MIRALHQAISRLVNHNYIQLVNRGNAAILLSILKCSGTVFAPQMGAWRTYKKYAQNVGKKYVEIDSPNARINIDDLRVKITDAPQGSMFMYHSLGAYCVAQDIAQIYTLCHAHKVTVLMDVSGSIGTEFSNGEYADVCVGSFGKWKIVEYGTGGFISTKTQEMFELFKPLFSAVTFSQSATEEQLSELLHKIDCVQERVTFLQEKGTQVIESLRQEHFEIIPAHTPYPFVVIVPLKTELERLKIIGYCTKNGLEYTQCPREIRIMQDAISIEIKRESLP